MRIGFVLRHPATIHRMTELLRTLISADHIVEQYKGQKVDILFAGALKPQEHELDYVDLLTKFDGPICLFSLHDGLEFDLNNFPEKLLKKCVAFIQMFWNWDDKKYNKYIQGRQITINPFLRTIPVSPIFPKKRQICFYGLATGPKENNIRIEACRLLRKRSWLEGGITGNAPGAQQKDYLDVKSPSLSYMDFLQAINSSRGTIALPGYNPLTYRLFEALAVQSVAIACRLDEFKWLNKLKPGTHYVEINPDLSDLLIHCEKILTDDSYAKEIVRDGYQIYREYYKLQSDGSLSPTMWNDIRQQFLNLNIAM